MNRLKPAFWLGLSLVLPALFLGPGCRYTMGLYPERSEFVLAEMLGDEPLRLTVTGAPLSAVYPPGGDFCSGVADTLLAKLDTKLDRWEIVQPRGLGYLSLARKENAIGLKVHTTYQVAYIQPEAGGTYTVVLKFRTWLASASESIVGGRQEAVRLAVEASERIQAASKVLAGAGWQVNPSIPWSSLAP